MNDRCPLFNFLHCFPIISHNTANITPEKLTQTRAKLLWCSFDNRSPKADMSGMESENIYKERCQILQYLGITFEWCLSFSRHVDEFVYMYNLFFLHVCTHVCMYLCVDVWIYLCLHIYIYTDVQNMDTFVRSSWSITYPLI